MNELLDAMLAEANHLGCNGNELDDRLSNSLRRIVEKTRNNIRRAKKEYWLDKYQEMYPPVMYPPVPRELTAAESIQIRGGIPLDNKPNT